ncbi:MAG: isoprenylcysteine carboxylmethyltransferase family protein [Ignavibacteriaceae bacterium]|nr:isoprenylcysteine carboxylmethyltransferase family protein [Ignavibacteriaceae bacterium]
MNNISSIAFKYRSYTPIPFLILMLIFQESTPLTLIIGFAVALIGELIRFWGVSWAGSETRTTGGVGGTFLIISGPFAYVRNPLYVGNILLYLGLGIMSFALFPYLQIVAIIFFLIQYYFIVSEEEKYLLEKFKDDYRDYCKNVPAFLPRLLPYKNSTIVQPPRNPKAGFRSEKRSLQAFIGISLLLIILWLIRS